MARSRNIKPGFFLNDELVELPFSTRLLFIGLWCLADREGRLENRPKKIKMQLFPADDLDLSKALLGLYEAGFLSLYSIDSIDYIQISKFNKHQNPHHKEAASTIPAPDSTRSRKASARGWISRNSSKGNYNAQTNKREPVDNSAPAQVRRAIAERDARRNASSERAIN